MAISNQKLNLGNNPFQAVMGLIIMMALLSSCSSLRSTSNSRTSIPGERIGVLTFEQALEADEQLASLQVTLPKPYINENWAQPGGNMLHLLHHLEIADNPEKIWSYDIGTGSGGRGSMVSQPVVKDNVLYAMDAGAKITAINADTGRKLWDRSFEIEGETTKLAYGGGVTVGDDKLYFVTGYGHFGALNVATGETIWVDLVGVPMRGAPTYADGRVFGVTHDNHVYAMDSETGEILWDEVGIAENAGLAGAASPTVIGNTVIVSYSSGEVYAMRVENGRVLWTDTLNRQGRLTAMATLRDIDGHPVFYDGNVYLISHSGRMAAVNLRSGIRVWEQNIGSGYTPWLAGDYIYIVTPDSEVLCITRRDGRIRWITQLERFEDPDIRKLPVHWRGPVLAGDRIIVTSSHGYAVTLSPYTGAVTGGIELPGDTDQSPIVSNGTLYFMGKNAEIIAMR